MIFWDMCAFGPIFTCILLSTLHFGSSAASCALVLCFKLVVIHLWLPGTYGAVQQTAMMTLVMVMMVLKVVMKVRVEERMVEGHVVPVDLSPGYLSHYCKTILSPLSFRCFTFPGCIIFNSVTSDFNCFTFT